MTGDLESLNDLAALHAFYERFARDRDSGRVRPLSEYQDLYPRHANLIASEYAVLLGERSDAEPAPSTPLQRIGPYLLERELGRGGQGLVWLATDTRLGRKVALKILAPGLCAATSALDRFRREAEVASRLDHPGICPVYEVGQAQGMPFIAMKYVEGASLAQIVARDRDSGTEASSRTRLLDRVRLIEEAAHAVDAAHSAGIVHRDLKPGNLMVGNDGKPVILDFGLARSLEEDQVRLTRSGDVFGTAPYMAPEQFRPDGATADRRTDVYALGATLYEALTLRPPFDAPTREALYRQILESDPPYPPTFFERLPRDLRTVLETALDKDPDRRYRTAGDLAEDLRRVRMREPIRARPAGPLVRLQRWAQRNPRLATAIGGLFAVLLAGLSVALFLLSQRDRALAEKAAALSDYDRLGDFSRLKRLQSGAEALWPCEPTKVGRMKAWVDEGAELKQRLPGHREVLDRLRTSAALLPYTDQDRAADLAAHAADQEQIGKLRKQRDETAAALATAASRASPLAESRPAATSLTASRPSADQIRAALAKLDADIAGLDVRVHERLTWKFGSESEQFKHDTTATLVAELTAFLDPDPKKNLLADVRGRLAFAESVEHETIGKYETKWADAIRSIADQTECPKYGGLTIKPQPGLIPIEKDPHSGLWEFAHLQTTAPGTDPIPKRDEDGKLVVTESMGIVFVLIPGGAFGMGAIKPDKGQALTDPNVDPEAEEDESPVTEVSLDPFFISKFEMTQGQWVRLVGKNPSEYDPGLRFGDNVVDLRNPVEQPSWKECDLWLGRLGLVFPTEAQWEYAARGGTTTPRWTGLGKDGLAKAANLADAYMHEHGAPTWPYEKWNDGYAMHAPVGSFTANPFGLHDVLGNVCEWCRDSKGAYGETARQVDGLRSPSGSRNRVHRGGAWRHEASPARSADRAGRTEEYRGRDLGVRPARDLGR